MFLNEFFKNAPPIEIKQLSCDSRVPMKDCIFFCIKGIKYNGHFFVDEAIQNGANVIVYSEDIDINKNAIFVKVSSVEDVLNQVSAKFYDYPAKKLDSYVISGTNGRSSVSMIINKVLSKETKCASIGVLGINDGDSLLMSTQPTLTILDNQSQLRNFVDNGCKVCTFEATALSLTYKKLDMLKPCAFIYTNTNDKDTDFKEIGRDYLESLRKYVYTLDDSCLVVLNIDDYTFNELYRSSGSNKISYGKNPDADYVITDIELFSNYSKFSIINNNVKYDFESKLLSEANVYNLTAAIATLNKQGFDMAYLSECISSIECLDGVVDRLNFDDFNIYVDCAVTTGSYRSICSYGKLITKDTNRLIAIVSINDTDTDSKIKSIIDIVDEYSNLIILTIGDAYEDEALTNMKLASKYIVNNNKLIIEDREGAIEEACELLNKGDTLLIIGKGNEDYIYQGLVKKTYIGDKNNAYKYLNKRLKEESLILDTM